MTSYVYPTHNNVILKQELGRNMSNVYELNKCLMLLIK